MHKGYIRKQQQQKISKIKNNYFTVCLKLNQKKTEVQVRSIISKLAPLKEKWKALESLHTSYLYKKGSGERITLPFYIISPGSY